jgi:hypothetical protein
MVDPRLEALDYLANATHLVELDLELVDFAQDSTKAGDFGVGHCHRVTSAVVLDLGGRLGLLRELRLSIYNYIMDGWTDGWMGWNEIVTKRD